ncbi:MAG TPA: hypothetical protein VF152_14850 [Acidimicrobiia bacterium]
MPTDPYVPSRLEDEPRQLPNLAPGVKIPPPKAWRPDRPGDLPVGQPHGSLLGNPGPNIGYAMSLAERVRDRVALSPHEHVDDALGVVAELAMRRAASFGRAPVMTDVDVALTLLGYQGDAPADFVEWRTRVVHGAHRGYEVRRRIVDAVPLDVLRLPPDRVAADVGVGRDRLREAVPAR